MRCAGAVGEPGRVEFGPAMVNGRAGSGAVRLDAGAGVSMERTRAAGATAGLAWLRALATAGPWLDGRRGAAGHPGHRAPGRTRAAAGSAALPLRCSSPLRRARSARPPSPRRPRLAAGGRLGGMGLRSAREYDEMPEVWEGLSIV